MAENSMGDEIKDTFTPDADGMIEVYEISPGRSYDYMIVRGLSRLYEEVSETIEDWNDKRIQGVTSTLNITVETLRLTPYKWELFCES